MNLKQVAPWVTFCAAIVVYTLSVDARYAHAKDVEKQQTQTAAEIQRQAKEDKLRNLRLEIKFLNSKSQLTQDEKDQLEFDRAQVKKLEAELLNE